MDKLLSGAEKLGLHLSKSQLEKFEIYYRELVDWNKKMNLTTITEYQEVQTRHFLDSLTVVLGLDYLKKMDGFRAIDVGTGAGLPGIPLKIALPELRLSLLDSTAKKASFLKSLLSELSLDDVEVIVGRAEEIARERNYRERFDVVLSRAVAPMTTLAELTIPFCIVGGLLIAQKKGDISEEMNKSRRAVELMGGSLHEVRSIELPELDGERRLVIIKKVKPTPPVYPRRPGMPAKRPLL